MKALSALRCITLNGDDGTLQSWSCVVDYCQVIVGQLIMITGNCEKKYMIIIGNTEDQTKIVCRQSAEEMSVTTILIIDYSKICI